VATLKKEIVDEKVFSRCVGFLSVDGIYSNIIALAIPLFTGAGFNHHLKALSCYQNHFLL